ncbi:MAG: PAS domain S-box protein [Thermoleophilia bacterium]
MRRERDFSDAVVDTAPTLVIVFDREGRIVRFNRTCELVTGYAAREVLGHGFWDIFLLPAERDRVRDALDRVWDGDFPRENENVWRTRDGRGGSSTGRTWASSRRPARWSTSSRTASTSRSSAATVPSCAPRAPGSSRPATASGAVSERNLHDGAQQRLVALSLTLRMAEAQVGGNGDGPAATIAAARDELNLAITELRELARGIHPAVLTDRGLAAALDALAGALALPVEVRVETDGRLPAPVEVAAYYVARRSLANVAKSTPGRLGVGDGRRRRGCADRRGRRRRRRRRRPGGGQRPARPRRPGRGARGAPA